jgi:anaerobic selenocysteine-containing dehydrogenase
MVGNDRGDGPDEGVSRRRFVQVCVGVATVAAVGSTVSSFLGIRSPIEVALPPLATEAVATCPVCSVGCGLVSISSGGVAYPPRGDPQSSSTSGMVCTRGALPPATVWPSTIASPLKRRSPSTKGTPPSLDQFEPVDWEEAISSISQVMVELGATNPAARGCILGGDLSLEDAYVAGKLFKGALSSPSIDTVESLHSRATDRVLLDQLGEVASPTCLNDIGLASLIVVVGEDLATTHPVAYARVAEAVATKGATLVVIDPRVTETVRRSRSVHVPVRAGGEVALFNAISNVLAHELEVAPPQWALERSLNARAFAEFIKLYSPVFDENERVDADYLVELCDGPSEWVGELGNRDAAGYLKSFDVPTITGVDAGTIRDLARKWNLARNVLTIWSSRISGAGDDGAAASSVVNLHLFTGQIGRPGAGPLGLQAMASGRGAMDGGASPLTLPGAFPGGGEPSAALQEVWGLDMAVNAARLPPGMGVIDMLNKAKTGELLALLLLGGSVSSHLPDTENLVRPALKSIYVVSTARDLEDPDVAFADMVLPRASWYEREAHYVSSERKVTRSLPSLARLDGTRTDMEFLASLGTEFVGGPAFDFPSPTVALDELKRASSGAPADISAMPLGVDLTDSRGMQWPIADPVSASSKGTPRRHMGQDGRGTGFPTETGRALTLPREHPGLRRPSSPEYPMTAIMSIEGATWWDNLQFLPRGGDVVRPRGLEAAYMEVGSEDAMKLGLVEGSMALVTSAQGSLELPVRIMPSGAQGHVFIPWGADAAVQALAPSLSMDGNGVPPWSAFPVRVGPAPLS